MSNFFDAEQNSTLPQLALQKAEHNTKEIVLLNKKVKEINSQIENISSTSATSCNCANDISSLQSAVSQNTTNISSLQNSVSANATNISTNATNITALQSQVATNTSAIATLQQGGGGGNDYNKLCYYYRIGGLTGFSRINNNSKSAFNVYAYTTVKTYCKFGITLILNKSFNNETTNSFKAYVNNNEVFCEATERTLVDKKTYEFKFSFYATLDIGLNDIYLRTSLSITNSSLTLYLYQMEINSNNKIYISTHQDFNLTTNGINYIFKNGLGHKYIHFFNDESSLLNFNYKSSYNSGYIKQSSYPADIQYVFMPTLNSNTNLFEKSLDYVYCSPVSNTLWIYYSDSDYKSFGNVSISNSPFGFSEYYTDTIGGVAAIYQGIYNNQPKLICCYRYNATNTGYGYSTGTLPENFGTIFYYDMVKTLSNSPMQNLTCIAFNNSGKAFFIKADNNNNKPIVNCDNIVQIFENIKKSHTYLYNNNYYCFYSKDNCVRRKIFSYTNNIITTISDEDFSYSEEIIVVNDNYIIEIKNGLPYFIERNFYE